MPTTSVLRAPAASVPRTSMRSAPTPPSGCGRLNIGSRAVRRSRRLADMRALIRTTSGNRSRSSSGDVKFGAVAVVRADRLGEPAQLAARPCRASNPRAVVPGQAAAGQRSMVLAGAGRPGRAVDGDVDLVADRQLVGEVTDEQARQARRHTGTDHEGHIGVEGGAVEFEHRRHVVELVTDRDGREPAFEQLLGESRRAARCTPTPRHPPCRAWPRPARWRVSTATTSTRAGPPARCARSASRRRRARRARCGSSRPIREFERAPTPVLWRRAARSATRSAAATATASATADSARRISFTSGRRRSAGQGRGSSHHSAGPAWSAHRVGGPRTCSPGSWWG